MAIVENLKVQSFIIDRHTITPENLTLSKKVFAYQMTLFLYQGNTLKYALIPNNRNGQWSNKDLIEMEMWAENKGLDILSKQSIIETENGVTKECQDDIRNMFGLTVL